MSSSKVAPGTKLYQADPVAATGGVGGAVSSWFTLFGSTITGAGYSSIRDLLDPTSPLTETQDNRRPVPATSANGLPIITGTAGFMVVPLTAARTNTTTWGWWGWLKQTAAADNITSFHTINGGSVARSHFWVNLSGTRITMQVFNGAGNSRFVDVTGLVAGNWQFVTLEFNGNRSGDARCIISVNGSVPTQTYATASGVSEMPSALQAITGIGGMFGLGTGGPFFQGSWGTNFGYLGAAMVGATEGLLTQQARLSLMNYQRPT